MITCGRRGLLDELQPQGKAPVWVWRRKQSEDYDGIDGETSTEACTETVSGCRVCSDLAWRSFEVEEAFA